MPREAAEGEKVTKHPVELPHGRSEVEGGSYRATLPGGWEAEVTFERRWEIEWGIKRRRTG